MPKQIAIRPSTDTEIGGFDIWIRGPGVWSDGDETEEALLDWAPTRDEARVIADRSR